MEEIEGRNGIRKWMVEEGGKGKGTTNGKEERQRNDGRKESF